MDSVFVAWQDKVSRRWFVVGELGYDGRRYHFAYTKGAKAAEGEVGFEPLIAFPNFDRSYESEQLFPLFANRVLPKNRPEFHEQLEYLNLPTEQASDFEILKRSSGLKVTDSLEIIARPTVDADGCYVLPFFVRGIRYLSPDVQAAIATLEPGDVLKICKDVQNDANPRALGLRTNQAVRKDWVGYCPDFYVDDINQLLDASPTETVVRVDAVNLPPAPEQYRLRCILRAPQPAGFVPFAGEVYQPLVPATLR